MLEFNYQTICNELLENLPQRQQQVLLRRFGLADGSEAETLQKIGDDMGITRERVRQLEKSGFLKLKELGTVDSLKKFFEYLKRKIQESGGIKREDILLKEVSQENERSRVHFLMFLMGDLNRFSENDKLFSFWTVEKEKGKAVEEIVKKAKDIFSYKKRPMTTNEISEALGVEDKVFLTACLDISREIDSGPLGDYGLSAWPEIRPKGVKDVAFLALKKEGKPLHFRLIAQKAGELKGDFPPKRKILPQTVHNELIRDQRFILVGRGIYGLSDWGYNSGTVKDVIYNVLLAGVPMNKQEILQAVQKQRIVKPNTVFLNLSDKDTFSKNENGKYILKVKTA